MGVQVMNTVYQLMNKVHRNRGIYTGIVLGEGGMFGFLKALQGQDLFRDYGMMYFATNIPDVLRPLILWVFRNVLGEKRKAHVFQYVSKSGIMVRTLYHEKTDGLRDFQKRWLAQYRELAERHK